MKTMRKIGWEAGLGSLAPAALAMMVAAAGCGGRPDAWGQPPGELQAFALSTSVALVDAPADRVLSLKVGSAANDLAVTRFATGRNIVAAAPAPGGDKLYVLTTGHRAALGDTLPDEAPRLTVIPDAGGDAQTIDLQLTDPLDGLAIDPAGKWAVVYAASAGGKALVTNPNDLVIVDLAAMKSYHHTVHSFGGRPDKLVFTPELALPNGSQQLLIVQSQLDLALVVLDPNGIDANDEITVRLSDATAVKSPAPAQVVVTPGDVAAGEEPRIGIRFSSDSSVMTLGLGARNPASTAGFAPSVNVADVGGVPSDIAFVHTDGGLRLAALVPAAARAVLVDPATTTTTDVDLPAPYQRISLVTAEAGSGDADLALLWQGGQDSGGVAFWELAQAAGTPFRSIETVGVSGSVSNVLDVPRPAATDLALKVLATARASAFYVLDLSARTAAPLVTSVSDVVLTVSPTGKRVWTFAPRGLALASTELATKQVSTLRADSPIDAVFEIAHSGGDGKRALLALHAAGGVGATVYDVDSQDDSKRRIYGALLEEGPYANQ